SSDVCSSDLWRDSPERAAAAYDIASLNYGRAKKLFEAGLIAQQELDARATELRMARDDLENAKQLAAVSTKLAHDQVDQANLQAKVTREELQEQLRQAEVNYERAKLQADRTVVRATTAGVVSEIPVRLGDRVPGGAVLARLAKLDHMIAEVPVAAQMISELSLGQSAQVGLFSSPPRKVEGRIRTIDPLPSQNMTHIVEVEFDNPTILLVAGQPAEVKFMKTEEHTSELQSRFDLVCRLLLEKKKKMPKYLLTLVILQKVTCISNKNLRLDFGGSDKCT